MKRKSKLDAISLAAELRPVDGEFKSTAQQRLDACVAAGHPLVLINLSKSKPGKYRVDLCICGQREKKIPQDAK